MTWSKKRQTKTRTLIMNLKISKMIWTLKVKAKKQSNKKLKFKMKIIKKKKMKLKKMRLRVKTRKINYRTFLNLFLRTLSMGSIKQKGKKVNLIIFQNCHSKRLKKMQKNKMKLLNWSGNKKNNEKEDSISKN